MTAFNREQSGIGEFASDTPDEPDSPETPQEDTPPNSDPDPS